MRTKSPTLRVAAAQPVTKTDDLRANALAHADAVRRCRARLVVFPEMSLSGYSMEAPAVDVDDPALGPLVDACEETGSIALAGAAVPHLSGRAIGVLAVAGTGVEVVYRKVHLGGPEIGVYVPGTAVAVVEVSGWRIGLGICKDTRIDGHTSATIASAIDLYAAGLVHRPHEVDQFDVRARRICALASVPVVFAGYAGPTGGGYTQTCVGSAIWDANGHCVIGAGDQPGEHVCAELTT
jgi:predicted amidohydrolase